MRKLSLPILILCLSALLGCFKRGPEVTQPPISISLLSNFTALSVGESAKVNATVYDQSGQGVVWSISPLNFGTLSNPRFDAATLTATVTYTAPTYIANPNTVTITATSMTDPNISSSLNFHFSPILVSLQLQATGFAMAAQTVNPGGQVFMTSSVTNDISSLGASWTLTPATGAGSLTVSGPTQAVYASPPGPIAAPIVATITVSSVKDPTVSTSVPITVLPSGGGPNVVAISVDGGPIPGQIHANGAFTNVTICNPGSVTACQAVGGILVDTGSYGLRILQSQIPTLKLLASTDSLGNSLQNCASWPDGSFAWGAVSSADVYIGGEVANSLPIQVISNASAVVPNGCSNGGSNMNTAQLLGANGILGIGPEPTDCTLSGINFCDGSNPGNPPNLYYACPNVGCSQNDSPISVGVPLQVSNPVPFLSDRNGLVLQFPPVSSPQSSLVGTMTFGIGTETNNALGSATVLTLDPNDNFTTVFNGQSVGKSSIDSGSSALLFAGNLPICTVHTTFYCPSTTSSFSATVEGATQGQSTVDFSVDNADTLFSTYAADSVFGTLAGPAPTSSACGSGASCIFNWGLPFLYGRTVYEAIDGQVVSSAPKTPWWAF